MHHTPHIIYDETLYADAPKPIKPISKIRIYPNPVKEILNIDILDNDLAMGVEINIYDRNGRWLLSTQQTRTVNVSALPQGVYLIIINSGSRVLGYNRFIRL